MKFTKTRLITTGVVIGISLIGAKLSLKTMEKMPPTAASSKSMPPHEFMRSKFGWPASRYIETLLSKERIKKLTSTAALDEFRDSGTVDREPLYQFISYDWALKVFKPAMIHLFPFGVNQLLPVHGYQNFTTFSPEGTKIFSHSDEGTAYVLTQQGKTWIFTKLINGENIIRAAFSFDGTKLITISNDNSIQIWKQMGDTWTSEVFPGTTHGNIIAISPNGTKVVTFLENGIGYVWTQQDDTWTPVELRGHIQNVGLAAFSPDGTKIITASNDTFLVWTEQPDDTWTSIDLHFRPTIGSRCCATFSPDSTKIAAYGIEDRTINIWRQRDNDWTLFSRIPISVPTYIVSNLRYLFFSLDSNNIISFPLEGSIYIWKQQNEVAWTYEELEYENRTACSSANFYSDMKIITTPDMGGIVISTQGIGDDNIANKIMLLQLLKRDSKTLREYQFERDGKTVLEGRNHLQDILNTFTEGAKKYLIRKYKLV